MELQDADLIDEIFDVAFWPVAADFKYEDVRNYPDGHIDLCLFNGAIRTSEQREDAELFRRKCKVLIAYGACAAFGGIPGLGNLASREELLEVAYGSTAY